MSSDNEFETIGRHIPPGLSADGFVDRCGAIYRSTVDRLSEANVRRIVLGLGFDPKGVKDLRSLKLLEVIVGAAILAKESGFDLIDDRTEIVSRFEGGPLEPMTELKSGQLSDSKASKSTNQDERPISEIDRVGESHHLVDGQGGRLLSLDRW